MLDLATNTSNMLDSLKTLNPLTAKHIVLNSKLAITNKALLLKELGIISAEEAELMVRNKLIVSKEIDKKTTISLGDAYKGFAAKLGMTTKSLTSLLGTIAIIGTVIAVGAYAWDKSTTTVEEASESIDKTKSKISDIESKIKELNNINTLSIEDKNKLKILKEELEVQKKILKIEDKRRYRSLISSKITNQFDKDNLNSKYNIETNPSNDDNYINYKYIYKDQQDKLDELYKQKNEYVNKIQTTKLDELNELENKILTIDKEIDEALIIKEDAQDHLYEKAVDYLDSYQQLQEAINSNLLRDSDLKNAKRLSDGFLSMYNDIKDVISLSDLSTFDLFDEMGIQQQGKAAAAQYMKASGIDISDENTYQAVIDIKGEFDTESWSVNDWIDEIQNRLNGELVTVPFEFSEKSKNILKDSFFEKQFENDNKEIEKQIEKQNNLIDRYDKRLAYQKQLQQDATDNKLEEMLIKPADWGLEEWSDKLLGRNGANPIQHKFGNVDMDKRTIIHWNNELKKTWSDALKSWDYDPEIGGIDTVFGTANNFTSNIGEIPISFTPIMVDKNGNNPEFLSQGTVNNYIGQILDNAYEMVSTASEPKPFEIYKKVIDLDANGRWVNEYNSAGEVIGNKFVQGIISGIGNYTGENGELINAEIASMLTHFAGDYGAINIASNQESLVIANITKEQEKLNAAKREYNRIQNEILQKYIEAKNNQDIVNKVIGQVQKQEVDKESVLKLDGIKDLVKLMPEYKDLVNETTGEWTKQDEKLEEVAEELAKIINAAAKDNSVDELNTTATAIASLSDAYENFKAGKSIDISQLDALQTAFGEGSKAYKNFENAVMSGTKDLQPYFNDLATEIMDTDDAFEHLTQDNYKYYESTLKSKGITNSHILALQQLDAQGVELDKTQKAELESAQNAARAQNEKAEASAKAWMEDKNLTVNSAASAVALMDQGVKAGYSAVALENLALKELAANRTKMDLSQQIQSLYQIASAAGLATASIGATARVMSAISGKGTLSDYYYGLSDIEKQTWLAEEADKAFAESAEQMADKFKEVGAGLGSAADTTKDAGGSAKDAAKDVDNLAEAYQNLYEIVETYNENGEISIEQADQLAKMDLKWIALLKEENGAISLNGQALTDLTEAKRELMVIEMYENIIKQIDAINSEADAMELLTSMTKAATEGKLALLKATLAQKMAEKKKFLGGDEGIAQLQNSIDAAEMIIRSAVFKEKEDKDKDKDDKDKDKDKDKDDFEEEFDWIERLLDKINKWTQKIATTIENLYSFQKKNFYIDKQIASINREISTQKAAYDYYYNEAEKLGVRPDLKSKVKNGAVDVQIFNAENSTEGAVSSLQKYIDLYDKAMKAKDAIDELYNSQRDLIRQKLDNVVDYYGEIDSYLSSITAKFESLISLNEAKGKKSSLVELLQEFNALQDAITTLESSTSSKEYSETTWGLTEQEAKDRIENAMGTSEDAVRKELETQEKALINVESTGTYTKLYKQQLKLAQNLAKKFKLDADKTLTDSQKLSIYESIVKNGGVLTDEQINNLTAQQKAQYDKYIGKSKDKFDTLQEQMNAIASGATQNTAAEYLDAYKKMQSFADKNGLKLDETGLLSEEAVNGLSAKLKTQYEKLAKPLENIQELRKSTIEEMDSILESIKDGTYEKNAAQRIKEELDEFEANKEIEESGAYQVAEKNVAKTKTAIEKLVAQAAKKGLTLELDEDGYIKNVEALNQKQYSSIKKNYEKQKKLLDNYYAEEEALRENATISNVAEYDKIWQARQKLIDKLESKGSLSLNENQQLKVYDAQIEAWNKERQDQIKNLKNQLALETAEGEDALIEETYKQSVEDLNESFDSQMKLLLSGARDTKQYKNIEGQIEALKQKQSTKGLSKSEEQKLAKYEKELAALDNGATSTNITEYIKAYEQFIKLQEKIDNNKTLSKSESEKYDNLKAQLDAWNKSKQEEIQMLIDQWQEGLQNLKTKYDEDMSDAEQKTANYYEKLWGVLKQIAEYGVSNLEDAISKMESSISYLQTELDLYQKLNKQQLIYLGYLEESDDLNSKIENDYKSQIELLDQKLAAYKEEQTLYQKLVDSLYEADYEDAQKAMLDAINESTLLTQEEKESLLAAAEKAAAMLKDRAEDSTDWDDNADEWFTEWYNALNNVKSEAINTILEVQELRDTFREWELSGINDAITQLESLKNALASISSVINDNWLFDDNGITEFGLAKVNLLSQQLTQAQSEVGKYAEIVNKIQATASDGSTSDSFASEKEKQEALNEAMQNYYNSLSSAYELENQIYEIAQKSQEEEINTLTKLVNKYKEMLNAKKELANYRKDIEASQKTVESLEAQIKAIEGVNTAEANAKRAQLEAQLEDAKQQLEDKQDEHNYNNIVNALDDMLKELEDALNNSADTIAETFEHFAETVKSLIGDSSGADVNSTMKKVTDLIMMDVSDAITKGISVGISESSTEASSGSYVKISDTNVSTMSDTLQKIYELSNKKLDTINANMGSKMDDMISKLSDISGYTKDINKSVSDINLNVESLITIDSMSLAGMQGELSKYTDDACKEVLKNLSTQLKKLGINIKY